MLPIRMVLLSPAMPDNIVADIDIIIACSEITAGVSAQADVAAAGGARKRL